MNTAGTFNCRTVVETELFAAQCMKLGNAQRVDEALVGVYWALASYPEDYPIVPGTQRLRMAKTQYVEWVGGIIKPLRIWFTIERDETVLCLAIDQLEDLEDGLCSDADDPMRSS